MNSDFKKEIAKMKSFMSPNDINLYASLIVTGADGHDLDILLTSIFISGKGEGVKISMDTIKEYCSENNISLK